MKERFAMLAACGLILGVASSLEAGSLASILPGPAVLASAWESRPTEHLVMIAGVVLLGLALWRRARHPHP